MDGVATRATTRAVTSATPDEVDRVESRHRDVSLAQREDAELGAHEGASVAPHPSTETPEGSSHEHTSTVASATQPAEPITQTSEASPPTGNAGERTPWARRRPIFLGQVLAMPPQTDWRRVATVFGVLAFFVWILSGFLARSDDTQRIARRLEESAREVAKQETKVEALRTQVAYLSTDGYVEVAAREKLGLVKPGDHPVIVLPEKDEVAWVPPAPPERQTGPFGPRYGRLDDWVRLFFGRADEGILGKS